MASARKVLSRLKVRFPRTAEFVRERRPSLQSQRRHFEGRSPEDVFSEIHDKNLWGNDESLSGGGSTITAAAPLLAALPRLFAELDVKRLLDVPCGDFHWMSQVDLSALDQYTGADIVPALIDEVREKYAAPKRSFTVLNLIEDALPPADLILCRDCFIHLSNDQVARALANVRQADCEWLLTTTFPDVRYNPDVFTGGVRTMNLRLAPFNLPAPQQELADPGRGDKARRVLGLWHRTQLS